jgi:hypothetical protein
METSARCRDREQSSSALSAYSVGTKEFLELAGTSLAPNANPHFNSCPKSPRWLARLERKGPGGEH